MTYYQITLDGALIHDSRVEDTRVLSPSVDFSVGASGRMSFRLPLGHPDYDNVHKLSSVVTLWVNDEWEFEGRVLNDDTDISGAKTIEVEGELALLNDSVALPYSHQGDIRPLVELYVAGHNAQVNAAQRFTVGLVTVTDPNGYITRASSQYPGTWEEMSEKLPDLLGGYFRTRRDDGVRVLDYLETYGRNNTQVIRFGENLLDLKKYVKGEDIATVILPLGAQIQSEDIDGEEDDKRLTIETVNDGKLTVEDADAIALYGRIVKTAIFDNVTTPTMLMTRGYQTLAARKLLGITLEMNAVDLSLIDVSIDRIKVGDLIRTISEPHKIDDYLTVTDLHLDLTDPLKSSIVLGTKRAALTDEIPGQIGDIIGSVIGDYATNKSVNDKLGNVVSQVTTDYTSMIAQTADEIALSVKAEYTTKTELGTAVDTLNSTIEQNASGIDFRFEQTNQSIETLNGTVVQNQEELATYIRFNLDGMELGKLGSEFIAKLSNTELAFLQNGGRVAYISNNKMVITDAEIKNNLALGSPEMGYFDFIPRSNGNLSFKYRG